MTGTFCACCGRRFERTNPRGRAPSYCSGACRQQMAVRRQTWSDDWQSVRHGGRYSGWHDGGAGDP